MFKIYKNFKLRDWIGLVLIIGFTFLQVYLTMEIVDYTRNIISAITYVNYLNNPQELEGLKVIVQAAGGFEAFKDIEACKAAFSLFGNEVVDLVYNIANASVKNIYREGGLMIALAAAIMVVQALISILASYVAADLSTITREKLYKKVESFSLSEIHRFSTPSLVTRTSNDIQQVQMANLMIMRMIFAAPITAIWAIVKIKASSTELTVATIIAIVLLLIAIFSLMLLALPKFKIVQKLTDKLNAVTRENLTGIRIIRAFNAENYQEDKFDEANDKFTKTNIFTGRVMAFLNPIMMIIMNGISLTIYVLGSSLINKGSIDYPTVTAFSMLASQIIMSFLMLMMMFILVPRASVSAKRINEVMETETVIIDQENPLPLSSIDSIEFRNVSFKYESEGDATIKNISFTVNKGETLALIGATGSGKTTIVNLIPRLYDVTSGEILINGKNIKEYAQKDIHKLIGYVTQKGFLFKGSIKENIALGNVDMDIEDIEEAAKIAEAYDFIQEKEEKFDFEISQGGKNVSGGQRQRLCIARAIAINPQAYIFDDSFSALDYKTDLKVRNNLKNLKNDALRIIVGQRIGTIMDADKILVIDDGEIVGEGKHQDLLKTSPIYKEIALSQLSEEELGL